MKKIRKIRILDLWRRQTNTQMLLTTIPASQSTSAMCIIKGNMEHLASVDKMACV